MVTHFFLLNFVILDVSVTYSTMWNFTDIIPYFCEKIYSHLSSSINIVEEAFANQCQNSIIHRSVKLTSSMLAFTIYFPLYFSVQFLISHRDQNVTLTNYQIIACGFTKFGSLSKIPIERQIIPFLDSSFLK